MTDRELLNLTRACALRVCCTEEHHGCPYGDVGLIDCVERLGEDYEAMIDRLVSLGESVDHGEIREALASAKLIAKSKVTSVFGVDAERIMELAQADKAGRLVILPCKVGDTVYTRNHHGRIVDGKVVSIHENLSLLGAGGFVFTVNYPEYNGTAESGLNPEFLPSRRIYRNGDFGETVFLTREEAEAAPKGESEC